MPPRINTRLPTATCPQVHDALHTLGVIPSTSGWQHVRASDAPDVYHPQYDLLVCWKDPLDNEWKQLKVRHHYNTARIGKVGAEAVRGFGNRDAAGRLTEAIRSVLFGTRRRPATPPADLTSTFVATAPHQLLNPPPPHLPSAPTASHPTSTSCVAPLAPTGILLLPPPPQHSLISPPLAPIATPPPYSTPCSTAPAATAPPAAVPKLPTSPTVPAAPTRAFLAQVSRWLYLHHIR